MNICVVASTIIKILMNPNLVIAQTNYFYLFGLFIKLKIPLKANDYSSLIEFCEQP